MKRILIIRSSAIGDIVMASPLIKGLRKKYPDAHIGWLVDPAVQDLLHCHPDLDQVICWSKSLWKKYLQQGSLISLVKSMQGLASYLRSQEFDGVVDAQGLFRSRLFALLSGAKQRIGFHSAEPGKMFMTRIISKGPDDTAMSSEYYHLLESLGIETHDCHPELILNPVDMENARKKLRQQGITGAYAVICPFTTRPQKHWFARRWVALAKEIETRLALPVVLLGGFADQEASRAICPGGKGHPLNFTGVTTLGESAAIIQGTRLLIGVDTGLTHMGTAFHRPTVALFGATRPYLYTRSPLTKVVYHSMACSPCRRSPTCDGAFHCMESIHVHGVWKIIDELISVKEDPHACSAH